MDILIEHIYQDYFQESQRISRQQQRLALPFTLAALIFFLISGILFSAWLIPSGPLSDPRMRMPLWVAFLALLAGTAAGVIGANRSFRYARSEASSLAITRPGFNEFFQLFTTQRWWPKQILPGEKLQKFLSIIGREDAH